MEKSPEKTSAWSLSALRQLQKHPILIKPSCVRLCLVEENRKRIGVKALCTILNWTTKVGNSSFPKKTFLFSRTKIFQYACHKLQRNSLNLFMTSTSSHYSLATFRSWSYCVILSSAKNRQTWYCKHKPDKPKILMNFRWILEKEPSKNW